MSYALIGGTGLTKLAGLEIDREHRLRTPYGEPSHAVAEGRYQGQQLLFLPRHGADHSLAPHRINYRANIWALRELGARQLLSVNAVGGIRESLLPGHLVIPDQLIDYTWGREHTYFDGRTVTGGASGLQHIDFTRPYCESLRERLVAAAAGCAVTCHNSGTYAVTQGPRLETAAEIERLQRDGCAVVGMTGMPEAALARELELDYGAMCIVVNPAAGLGDEPITLASMQQVLQQGVTAIGEVLAAFLAQ